MELTCNLTSASMPVANRPKIRYKWEISSNEYRSYRYLRGRTVVHSMEDVDDGYTIENNDRTLRISSVRPDDRYVMCYGLEEESNPRLLRENYYKCRELRYWQFDEFTPEQFADALAHCYSYDIRRSLDLSMRREYQNAFVTINYLAQVLKVFKSHHLIDSPILLFFVLNRLL